MRGPSYPAVGVWLALPAWLLFVGGAWAHALGAECKLRGGVVEVEVYFDDDTPACDARVRLEDGRRSLVRDFPALGAAAAGWMGAPQGQGPFLAASSLIHAGVLSQGRTDRKGRWSCPAPAPGAYLLVVDAGAGHVARVPVTVPGARGTLTSSPPSAADGPQLPGVMPHAADAPVTISKGPRRLEFTAVPWGGVFLGLGSIGAAGLGLWLLVRRRQNRVSDGQPVDPPP